MSEERNFVVFVTNGRRYRLTDGVPTLAEVTRVTNCFVWYAHRWGETRVAKTEALFKFFADLPAAEKFFDELQESTGLAAADTAYDLAVGARKLAHAAVTAQAIKWGRL